MNEANAQSVDWRDLAAAIPGEIAVQIDDEFAYVSTELSSMVETPVADLVGASWRTLVDQTEAERLQSAIEQARDGDRWEGKTRLAGDRIDGIAVELTLSATDGGALVWAASERNEREAGIGSCRRQRDSRGGVGFVENVVDALDDVLYVVDEDGDMVFWNRELCERFGYDDDEVAELDPRDFLTPADADEVPPDPASFVDVPDRHNVADLVTSDGEVVTHEIYGRTYTDEVTGNRYRVGTARDITERLERQRELERQRDALATLDRINELLMETARELVQTNNRDAVERTVCSRLADSDLYRFAWVGKPAFDSDRIVPRTSAGDDDGYLDEIEITEDDSPTGQGPGGRAMTTGDVQVVSVDDPSFEPWCEAVSERGIESVAAVPLRHAETVYGVLVVYADREDAFSEREKAGFDVLGRTIGTVIYAARNRELLFADTVVELEFDVANTGSVVVDAAQRLDCHVSLEGYVAADDRWILYLGVDGAPPEDVIEVVADDPCIERSRVVRSSEDEGRVELIVAESSLLHTVTAAGATIRSATADPADARLVVEAPVDVDVRTVVEHVQRDHEGATLLARRERDREVTAVGRPGDVLDDLTERQRESLSTAYRAGYFRWPRESTAEEIATSLDISPPTLHGHLRKAEQTILSALLDEE